MSLGANAPEEYGSSDFEALGDGLTFSSQPLTEAPEITGPAAATLFISSTTSDADIFVVVRVIDPAGKDVTFVNGLDPSGIIRMGWLRASQRRTDPKLSVAYRPWHTRDRAEALIPRQPAQLDVAVWPTCVVVPTGYRLALTILGRNSSSPVTDPGRRYTEWR